MANTDITRNKIKSKLSAIKKINDDPNSLIDNVYDAYKDNLDSTDGVIKKNINDFTSKTKGGTQNNKDIFGEVVDIAEGFLGTAKEDPVNPKTKPLVQTKLLKYSTDSARTTLQSSKQVINDDIKKAFLAALAFVIQTVL